MADYERHPVIFWGSDTPFEATDIANPAWRLVQGTSPLVLSGPTNRFWGLKQEMPPVPWR